MKVTITCEECGHRHRLERSVTEPGPIWIVCHECEIPLQALLEGPVTSAPSGATPGNVWHGFFEPSDAKPAA